MAVNVFEELQKKFSRNIFLKKIKGLWVNKLEMAVPL